MWVFVYYRPQTKFAKVMFLQVSVILSTGGGGHVWLLLGGCVVAPGECMVALGGACVVAWGGMHGCSRGEGVHGCSGGGGHAWLLGEGGACVVFSIRYGQ